MTSTSDPANPIVTGEVLPVGEASQVSQPEPPPSYVKLAMRNMVRKRTQSLVHFGLTVTGLLALLIGLSYLTR